MEDSETLRNDDDFHAKVGAATYLLHGVMCRNNVIFHSHEDMKSRISFTIFIIGHITLVKNV